MIAYPILKDILQRTEANHKSGLGESEKDISVIRRKRYTNIMVTGHLFIFINAILIDNTAEFLNHHLFYIFS